MRRPYANSLTVACRTMKLILLGTSGYHPSQSRHTACLLLPACGAMLDAGTGMFRAGQFLETPTLDIFLSHAHLDHVVGLTYLFSVHTQHRLERVTVHAEPDKLAAVREHLFSEGLFPGRPAMELRALEGEVVLPDGARVGHFPLEHQGGSRGFRLDWPDRSMAYVTDTTADPQAPYVEHLRGVDLLVHECYATDEQAEWARRVGHSHTTAVAQVARQAGAGRLILVHINPLAPEVDPIGLDAARAVFERTELGRDLMEIEF